MSTMTIALTNQAMAAPAAKTGSQKPVWNGKKAYTYLEDMNTAGIQYGKEAAAYYSSLISKRGEDGAISKEELMSQLKELFPEYTFTNHEPKDVQQGKHYLYIDENNLKRMQEDSNYRAKVYGLMDRELTTGKEYTMTYSDGRKVTSHITGSIFSLADTNKKYAGEDGIPYRGSGSSDHPFSSSNSHPQMRSMTFAHEVMNAGKGNGNQRSKKTNNKTLVTRLYEERLKKKKERVKQEKKQAEKESQKKAEEERLEKRQEERNHEALAAQEQMMAQSPYKSVSDVQRAYQVGNNSIRQLQDSLSAQYEAYSKGMVQISKSFLRSCLSDEEKMGKLHEMLQSVDSMYENAKNGGIKGFLGMKAKINSEGELETETYGGSVAVNEMKRAAQIANSKTMADIKMVMNLLAEDMEDCKRGLRQGLCDEEEVNKVKRLIEKAEKRQMEIEANGSSPMGKEELTINVLL
ncbi:MAG: hypothetical protein J6D02_09770 [Lachnospira sp.]|nr:hypothetical protein [Lachnospira sp.]